MNDQIIPAPAPTDLPTATILAGGRELDPSWHVLGIAISHEVNRVPWAQIDLLDGDASIEDFPLSGTDTFVPGRRIEIRLGYHSAEQTVFDGIVVRHAIHASGMTGSRLTLTCKDPVVRMTAGRRSAVHSDLSDQELMESLVVNNGLEADVEPTAVSHTELVQYQACDWDLLVTRAEANGMLVFAMGGRVSVKAPDPAATPVLSLLFGATLLDIEAEVDVEQQWNVVTCSAWNPSTQQPVEVDGVDPGHAGSGNFDPVALSAVLGRKHRHQHHGGALDTAELEAHASASRARSRLAKVRGRLRCSGTAAVRPGDVVDLQGVGDRFSGPVWVSGVRHSVESGGWTTDLQIGLSTKGFLRSRQDVHAPPAMNALPSIPGLQVGLVTSVEGDPDGEPRVQVRLPLVAPDDDGIWARVATLDAGRERGTFFRPEPNDEVLVGFLHGDPRHPVILGMLHSSAHPPPVRPTDNNHQKGYVSRSGICCLFEDDKPALSLRMPSGRHVELDDDAAYVRVADPGGSEIVLDSDGVRIESSGDIKLKGTNVEITAQGELNAQGRTGAKVESTGIVTLKGAQVTLN